MRRFTVFADPQLSIRRLYPGGGSQQGGPNPIVALPKVLTVAAVGRESSERARSRQVTRDRSFPVEH